VGERSDTHGLELQRFWPWRGQTTSGLWPLQGQHRILWKIRGRRAALPAQRGCPAGDPGSPTAIEL